MIRIKCPKCAESLSLDDDRAGQVAACTECGAKFKVPARKTAAPTRPAENAQEKKKPAKRPREADDEDQQDEPRKKSTKSKVKNKAESGSNAMATSGVFLIAVIALAAGGVFINSVGLIVTGGSIFMMIVCVLMIVREGLSGGGRAGLLIWFLILAVVGVVAHMVHEGRIVDKRNEIRIIVDSQPNTVKA